MSNKPYKGFEPKWLLTPAPADSYRSIFRWGDPNFFKYPKESLYTLMKEKFQMTDDDFKAYSDDTGFDPVELPDHPVQLAAEHIEALKKIVGEQNVSTTDYDRLSVAYGATAYDLLRLRHKRIDSVPDVVLYPETTEQVEQIVAYSTEHHIPLYVYGGGSSVTRGVEPVKGGISLDMRRNFNKVISFNEIDQTITVQAGMSGPDLEKTLQSAPELFGAAAVHLRPLPAVVRVFERRRLDGHARRGPEQHVLRHDRRHRPQPEVRHAHRHDPDQPLLPRGHRPEPEPDHDGLRGHVRRADGGHAAHLPLDAAKPQALLLHLQDVGRGHEGRPRDDAVRVRLLVRVPPVRPGRDQPHAQAL